MRNGVDGLVVDSSSIPKHLFRAGTPMRIREAARTIGIPVRLLKMAESSRLLSRTSRSYHLRGPSWTEEDAKRARARLDICGKAAYPAPSAKKAMLVPLREVLRAGYLSLDYRLSLLRRYLKGKLLVARLSKGLSGTFVKARLKTIEAQCDWIREGRP